MGGGSSGEEKQHGKSSKCEGRGGWEEVGGRDGLLSFPCTV